MSSRKLSEQDIQELLDLYRQPGETTSTLASRYGVSNSTVSRILKNSLPETEYEILVQQKRSSRSQPSVEAEPTPEPPAIAPEPAASSKPKPSRGRKAAKSEPAEVPAEPEAAPPSKAETPKPTKKKVAPPTADAAIASEPEPAPETPEAASAEDSKVSESSESRRVRKRSSRGPTRNSARQEDEAQLKLELPSLNGAQPKRQAPDLEASPQQAPEVDAEEEDLAYVPDSREDLDDEDEDEDDLDDLDDLDDDDFGDEDDEDDEDDDEESGAPKLRQKVISTEIVKILPFAEASLPKVSYLVVDRLAELVARPLREFGDLGQIPEAEVQEKTLPIFDNHRVARRFSKRNQRVIKVPDSNMFQKALPYLQAKGITRLLIDGQVYGF
ncbi:helix-turn-helix domain-containing protein [Geitlerinema sp. PCC 7407]|uniref:helix-turn-helix domain-containing protein n=1 Tax=Geitlerinema sp. PCC 7407 TaxID=1173025 RepID=UPI00029FE77C|nr:helix-turn-helix domain-containing protein [Geitlerinema sp. PCC 7407]AFY67576.1 transposase IS3/IS911 family protein [Geitlerinema sp. PCC 7407]